MGVALLTSPSAVHRPSIVERPWGHEEIFALVEGKFCGKVLHVSAGHALSLQYHRQKEEVISVLQGTARVEIGDSVDSLVELELHEGDAVHLPPGLIHRVVAVSDLVLLEASSTELDDVVRLADEYGREDAAVAIPGQRALQQAVTTSNSSGVTS